MNECNDPDHGAINAERSESRGLRKAWIELDDKRQQLERELTAAQEEIERLKDHCRIKAKALINQTSERMKAEQQRDRLAEAVNAATILIAAKGRHNTMLAYNGLRDALQSLTPDQP